MIVEIKGDPASGSIYAIGCQCLVQTFSYIDQQIAEQVRLNGCQRCYGSPFMWRTILASHGVKIGMYRVPALQPSIEFLLRSMPIAHHSTVGKFPGPQGVFGLSSVRVLMH